MTTASVTWAPTVQWGGSGGVVWADDTVDPAGFPILGTGVVIDPTGVPLFAGILFDANSDQTLRFTTVNGQQRVLDPPILLTLSIRILAAQAQANNGTDNRIEVGVVPGGAVANYSNTTLPWQRGEQSLGIFSLANLPVSQITPTYYTLTFSAAASTLVRALVTSRANWNGRLALSLRAVGAHAINLYNLVDQEIAAVTTQQVEFFAGMTGGGGGKLRAVRDGRYGMPAWNTELIRDGDQPGLFVRAWDQDPEDETATYKRRPGEGTVDDHIPDL